MTIFKNDTDSEIYFPTLGLSVDPGASIEIPDPRPIEPEPVVDLTPDKHEES